MGAAAAGVDDAAELVVAGCAAAEPYGEEPEELDELPQPVRISRPVAISGAAVLGMDFEVVRELTGRILHALGVIPYEDPARRESFPFAPYPLPSPYGAAGTTISGPSEVGSSAVSKEAPGRRSTRSNRPRKSSALSRKPMR